MPPPSATYARRPLPSPPHVWQASPYVLFLFALPVHFWTHLGMLFFTGVWTTNIHDTINGALLVAARARPVQIQGGCARPPVGVAMAIRSAHGAVPASLTCESMRR